MLISELATRMELTIDTIRFYEKQGLIDETHYSRTSNGYRHYSEAALQRLTLIKLGQAAGFTLSEMRQEIHAWETNQMTPEQKELYLCRKLEDIEQKLITLNAVKAYITSKIEQMHARSEA
jgi:MerR family transcriptional regulator, copper efflux regulator